MLERLVAVMVMAVLVLTCGVFLVAWATCTDEVTLDANVCGNERAVDCVVVTQEDGTATLKDEQGNLWLVDDDELIEGDKLCVWLDDMNTEDDLTDDEIIDYLWIEVD